MPEPEKPGSDAQLGQSGGVDKSATGSRLAVCQNPHGLHEHVEVEGRAPDSCFADCDCSPRLYVALDEVIELVGGHAVSKYDPADNARRGLIRTFVRGEAVAQRVTPAFPELEAVRVALATWQEGGAQPWDLPPEAVHFALGCHGAEANSDGTWAALNALCKTCPECGGDGYFQDDSHPGNPSFVCEECMGHRFVQRPKPTEVEVRRGMAVLRRLLGEFIGDDEELGQMAYAVLRARDADLIPDEIPELPVDLRVVPEARR